jgi:Ni/Fe-hydrogenase subunit HybB-like protein
VEEIYGFSHAVATPRVNPEYLPSVSEWLVTAGIVGLGLLLFGFGEALLPREAEEDGHVRVR